MTTSLDLRTGARTTPLSSTLHDLVLEDLGFDHDGGLVADAGNSRAFTSITTTDKGTS